MKKRRNIKIFYVLLGVAVAYSLVEVLFTHPSSWSYINSFWFTRSVLSKFRTSPFTPNNFLLNELEIDCDSMWKHKNVSKMEELKQWKFDYSALETEILSATDRCSTIRLLFEFPAEPNSEEEADYPLAYGMVVYKNFVQLMFMLSSIYQPQNIYCLAVSDSAKENFKDFIYSMQDCFPNVRIMFRPPISWGSFEIINSTYECMKSLSEEDHPWEYFQYLSGFDAPLKTNLEMVKIFKALNESFIFEMAPYPRGRLMKRRSKDPPLPLYKSSLSSLVPRSTADFLVKSDKTQELLEFISETSIPDETFWATVGANQKTFPVPGGLNGESWLTFLNLFRKIDSITKRKSNMTYYISRYQVWGSQGICHGGWASGSCTYGVFDFEKMMQQPQLIAHKMYLDSEPASYFCALKEIRDRTRNPAVDFDTRLYSELPQVELKRGIKYKRLTHPEWMLRLNGNV